MSIKIGLYLVGVKHGQYEAFPPCSLGLQCFGAATDSCGEFWVCDVRPILRSAETGPRAEQEIPVFQVLPTEGEKIKVANVMSGKQVS